MTVLRERVTRTALPEPKSFRDIMGCMPEAVQLAKKETEASNIAHTPEGRFVLTYLLASRMLLKSALDDMLAIDRTLIAPTGGYEYNPQRTIDEIGSKMAFLLARQSPEVKNLWIRTEEIGQWRPAGSETGLMEESDRFAVIDPMDETSAIPLGDRQQSAAVAVFSKNGELLTLGVTSLVDDAMMFYERDQPVLHTGMPPDHASNQEEPIRIATLARRKYALRSLPLLTKGNPVTLESIGGFALLSMLNGSVDTMIDPVKGNPWYEYVLWGPAAEVLGLTVSDPEGNPIDTKAIMRYAIEKNPDDSYRVPFVVSRTPEIHTRVLSLLKPEPVRNAAPARSTIDKSY